MRLLRPFLRCASIPQLPRQHFKPLATSIRFLHASRQLRVEDEEMDYWGPPAETNVTRILHRFHDIEQRLSSMDYSAAESQKESEELLREHRSLAKAAELAKSLRAVDNAVDEAYSIFSDSKEDRALREYAEAEYEEKLEERRQIRRSILSYLLPSDPADARNAIVELRAATGGSEAAFFARDLAQMYANYAALKSFEVEVASVSANEFGGYKDATIEIRGPGAFGLLKHESGVHRVQRVPVTEAQGRVHTSTTSVAVLPEAEEVDIHIDEKDLRIDLYRSSGAGGQHVNTTDSAVRITHIPTGTVVAIQDERSQHKNKAKALRILRSRLYEAERVRREAERSQSVREQIGTGDRSERIRTYNFPQGRVTDHRVQLSKFGMDRMLQGEYLDDFIRALVIKQLEATDHS